MAGWSNGRLPLLLARGNQICLPPVPTELYAGLHSTTKAKWPPHHHNSHFLLDTDPLGPSSSAFGSLEESIYAFWRYLVSLAAACGLWLAREVFFLGFTTSAAVHYEGYDLRMWMSDRKEWINLSWFTVNEHANLMLFVIIRCSKMLCLCSMVPCVQ